MTRLWCRPPAYKGGQSPPLEFGISLCSQNRQGLGPPSSNASVPPSSKAVFQSADSNSSSTFESSGGRISPALFQALTALTRGKRPKGCGVGLRPTKAGRARLLGGHFPRLYRNATSPTDLFGCVVYCEGLKAKPEKLAPPELWLVELALDLAGWKPALLMGDRCVPAGFGSTGKCQTPRRALRPPL